MKNRILPRDFIPPVIWNYWSNKYGAYLFSYMTDEFIIFVENGTLDCFHPSGDKLARHHIPTRKTIYIWNNNVNEPLTESEYILKIEQSQGE